MTSFETQVMLGTTLSPLVAVDKGDVTNRVQCSAAQAGNTLKHLAADAVVIGGAAAGIAATKNKGIAKYLSKPITYVSNLFKDVGNIGRLVTDADIKALPNKTIKEKIYKCCAKLGKAVSPIYERVGKSLGKLSTRGKAIALIAAVTFPMVNYIKQRFSYRAGQIDQKYTDKAAIMRSGRKFV